jgi:hypothetical protein
MRVLSSILVVVKEPNIETTVEAAHVDAHGIEVAARLRWCFSEEKICSRVSHKLVHVLLDR